MSRIRLREAVTAFSEALEVLAQDYQASDIELELENVQELLAMRREDPDQ